MHPHPASVHFPIAFLALGCGLDLLQALLHFNPQSLALNDIGATIDIAKSAHYVQALGVISAVPAIITGAIDAIKAARSQDIYDKQTQALKPKFRNLCLHSVVATIAVLANFGLWYRRKGNTPELKPAQLWMEAASLGLMFLGANVGGKLVFQYGMGFHGGRPKGRIS
jgi:uncharacterized membrane protein